jgi:hypothetical protein
MQQQVFISYRHEGPEHARAVRRLAELLRQAKVPVALDQFLLEDQPGGPDEGWPKWCEDRANQSACVIIVASEGWFAAYDKDERAPKGSGLGAATEADLFRQALWDEKGHNARIRLAFLDDLDIGKVPARLRAWHQFRPFQADAELDQLARWAADCLGIRDFEPPSVRWPAPVDFVPDIADRNLKEWPAVVDLLAGRSRQRILLYEGGTGLGKSVLLRQVAAYAQLLGIPCVLVNFKGAGHDLEAILGQFDLDLGAGHLPRFCADGATRTHLLRKDLRALRRPVLAIFDTYEEIAENPTLADWLTQQFLPEVERALGLAVIIAGQRVPPHASATWGALARHIEMQPITDIAQWEPWIERRYPGFDKDTHLATVLALADGNPATVATYCDALAKKG